MSKMSPDQRSDLISCMWDGYKEIHGIRPRWIDFGAMSDEQLLKEYELFESLYQEYCVDSCADAIFAQKDMEQSISKIVKAGAKDRETAIRWMIDADDCEVDVESFLYNCGLNGSSMFNSYMQELEAVVTHIPLEDAA